MSICFPGKGLKKGPGKSWNFAILNLNSMLDFQVPKAWSKN